MLSSEHLQAIGTVIGAGCAALLARFVIVREAKKPHEAPPERPPTEHQVRAELAELRNRIDHANDLAEDDRRAISRQLDRIERTMDRICDRMDTDARIGSALAKIHRQEGG